MLRGYGLDETGSRVVTLILAILNLLDSAAVLSVK
jgi:hypothetical protein